MKTDEVFVAGNDIKSLRKGFSFKGIDLKLFQLEPGPMGALENI